MSDNELDNLFKEAAGDFESPQDSTAWEQMSARLDDHAAPSSILWNWRSIGLFTVVGLLVISAIWYTVLPDKKHNATAEDIFVTSALQNQVLRAENKNANASQSVQDESTGAPNPVKNGTPVSTHKDTPDVLKSKQSIKDKEIELKPFLRQLRQDIVLNQPATNEVVNKEIVPEGTFLNNVLVQEDKFTQHPHMVTMADSVAGIQADSVVNLVAPADSLMDSEKPDPESKKKIKTRSSMSIKLAVSPDFSSVNFSSSGKSGINYGALIGYTFNNRWSVYTGVISSKKLYSSNDVETSYAAGGNTYPVEKLDGDCRILDIPINVYYSFFPERSLSLSVGVGFSSYIMRKETYVYCVNYYGTDTYYEEKVKGKNKEWFKVLNLSIVAEKRLTNRLTAEVEPFIKVPLAGIGEGKISLVSLGAFVNVKFNLFKNP